MNPDLPDPHDPPSAEIPTPAFRWKPMAGLILVILLVFGSIFVFFGVLDGMAIVASWSAPQLAAARGTVKLTDEPLPRGSVLTKPTGGRGKGCLGVIENGKFVLKTDVNGTFVEGAAVGTHRVIVLSEMAGIAVGAAPAPSMIDAKFTSFDSTPLVIEVTSDPAKNDYSLVVARNEAVFQDAPAERGGDQGAQDRPAANSDAAAESESPPTSEPESTSESENRPTPAAAPDR